MGTLNEKDCPDRHYFDAAWGLVVSRFSKEQVSVEEITEAFVVDIAELANKSFDKWYDEFVGAANMLGKIPTTTMNEALQQTNPKTVYLAVFLAILSLPMEKIVGRNSAEKIYDYMRTTLKKYTSKKDKEIAPMVFELVTKFKEFDDPNPENVLLSTMRLLELDKHESTRVLFEDEAFLNKAKIPELVDANNWWEYATEKVQVVV